MTVMTNGRSDYQAYLLRLWRVSDEGELPFGKERPLWRASLQDSRTRERRGFASLEELFEFIRQQTSTTEGERPQA